MCSQCRMVTTKHNFIFLGMVVVDWEYGVNVGRWDVDIDEAEMQERVNTINAINNNWQQCISFNWYMKILILKICR